VIARLLAGDFAEAARAEPMARSIEFESFSVER
jgi:hypothetical protein